MNASSHADARHLPAPIVWITGLSGTGKTTLARSVVRVLRRLGEHPVLLDGDAVRKALDPPGIASRHDRVRRLERGRRMSALAHHAALQGTPAVVATISLFHEVQHTNRALGVPYGEVLLTADLSVLKERNPRLYGGACQGAEINVVGLDILAEYPIGPDLVIAQRFHSSDLPIHVEQVVGVFRGLTGRHAGRCETGR
jgi:adenylylsulfate kinase